MWNQVVELPTCYSFPVHMKPKIGGLITEAKLHFYKDHLAAFEYKGRGVGSSADQSLREEN